MRVLESADGEKWESAALLTDVGIDLRDPKLSVTPDDRLMMTAGGSVYEGKTLKGGSRGWRFPKMGGSGAARSECSPKGSGCGA